MTDTTNDATGGGPLVVDIPGPGWGESEDLGPAYGEAAAERRAAARRDAFLRRTAPAGSGVPSGGGATPPAPVREAQPDAPAKDRTALQAAGDVARDVAGGVMEAPTQVLGGVFDFGNAALGLMDDLAVWLNDNVADLTIMDPETAPRFELPEIIEAETATGGAVRGITQFLTGFVPVLGAMGKVGGATKLAAAGRAAGAGAVTDFVGFEGQEERLSDLWQDAGLPDNVLTDWLASDGTESELEGRFENMVEGAFAGVAADGILKGARLLRAGLKSRRAAEAGAGGDGAALPASGASGEDELAAARAEYGEVGSRDFIFLGDPAGPRIEMRTAAPATTRVGSAERGVVAPRFAEISARVQAAAEARKVTRDAMDEAIDVVRAGGLRPSGPRLTDFLIRAGGVQDVGGDVAAVIGGPRGRPALINNATGRGMDDAALHAWENGYFPHLAAPPEPREFLEALRRDNSGDPVYVREDQDILAAGGVYDDFAEELDRAGIDVQNMDNATIKARLAELEDDAARRSAAAEVVPDEARPVTLADRMLEGVPDPDDLSVAAPGGQGRIFVNFNRIEGTDDVKAVIGEMAQAFADDVDVTRRGRQSFAQTEALADELGMTVDDLLARRQGQPLNAEEALAARRLWAASAKGLLAAARKARDGGPTEQFLFRRMMAVHYAIQGEVLGARAETARALNAWKIPAGGGVEQAREIRNLLDAMGGPDASAAMARRLAILAEQTDDPAALSKFVRGGALAKTADAIKEIWINGLLSSPKTHMVNISSNLGVAVQQIYERKTGEGIAALRGGADGVMPGEAAAMAYGMVSGLKDAFRLSWKALRAGEAQSSLGKQDLSRENTVTAELLGKYGDGVAGRVVDVLGTVFRVPGRLLLAEDEFFKSIGYRMELHAQAARAAAREGQTGEAFGRRIAEFVHNPPEHMRIAAADAALYNTFTQKTGWFGEAMMKARAGDKPLSPFPYIIPFVRTPTNIARYSFERTPFAPLVAQWREDIAAGGARRDIALARMATGTAVMMIAFDYAESGLVTGALDPRGQVRDAQRRQGVQPFSIKVGERWYSYNRADPFGMLMGFAATVSEAMQYGEIDEEEVDEWQEVLAMGIAATSQTVLNKTYMEGLANVVEVMSDPGRYSEGYVNDLVASFVPFTSLASNIEAAVDPAYSEVGNPLEAMQARIAGLSERLTPRRDVWGREIRRESGLGRGYDFFSPVSVSKIEDSPIDAEIVRLGAGVSKIHKRTSFDGIEVNFRDWPEVYDAYVRMAGNELKHPAWGLGLKDMLDQVVEGRHALSQAYRLRSDGSDGGKVAFIREQRRAYKELAQAEILRDPKFARFSEWIRVQKAERQREALEALSGSARPLGAAGGGVEVQ